jgi:hypothetical protein
MMAERLANLNLMVCVTVRREVAGFRRVKTPAGREPVRSTRWQSKSVVSSVTKKPQCSKDFLNPQQGQRKGALLVGEIVRREKRWTPACETLPRKASMAIGQDEKGGTSFESENRLRLHFGSKPRTAAKAETMGYARAFRRAVDSQPRGRSDSGV